MTSFVCSDRSATLRRRRLDHLNHRARTRDAHLRGLHAPGSTPGKGDVPLKAVGTNTIELRRRFRRNVPRRWRWKTTPTCDAHVRQTELVGHNAHNASLNSERLTRDGEHVDLDQLDNPRRLRSRVRRNRGRGLRGCLTRDECQRDQQHEGRNPPTRDRHDHRLTPRLFALLVSPRPQQIEPAVADAESARAFGSLRSALNQPTGKSAIQQMPPSLPSWVTKPYACDDPRGGR